MKKKILFVILSISLLLSACSNEADKQHNNETQPLTEQTADEPPVSAVWLSCYELSSMLNDGTEESFIGQVETVTEKCTANGINTVFLQVRPFCDAFYPSDIFKWSDYALDKNGNVPDYDPLEIFISAAHDAGIELHAWINPYRISYDENFVPDEFLADFSVSCSQGVYLAPSRLESQKTVLDGVREILEKYDVDGIHIDDYFYPVKDKSFDSEEYGSYRESGGKLSLSDWRRSNVNSLVGAMYSLVHSIKPNAVFSISPAADIGKNKHTFYADVELWCRQSGYCDWMIPQIYFGFEHLLKPFEKVAAGWEKLKKADDVKLICGLASYKQNKKDESAGTGINEWIDNQDIISRQKDYVLKSEAWQGYSLFSYSFLA